MTTKIFLIRHAEAEGNLFRVAHGQYDSVITPRGYRQLAYLRRRFQNETIDAVYGSDLTRTHITASAIYVPRGLAFHPLPLLREVRLGDWEQMSWGEIQRKDRQMYIDFNKRPDLWSVSGAETYAQVRDRMLSGIRQIAEENPGKTVAATSHGAALRTLLGTLQGLSLEEIGATNYGDNTAVSLLEIEGEEVRVVFRDDVSHIPHNASTLRRQSWHKDDAATEPGLWFQTVQEDKRSRTAAAMLEESAIGRVSMEMVSGGLRVKEYHINPAYRGKRYGVQLLGQAVQFARAHELETVVLTCNRDLAGYFAQYGCGETGSCGENVNMALDLRRLVREFPEID